MKDNLVLQYLHTKLNQASADVALFTQMIQDQKKLIKDLEATTRSSKFLSLVANKGPEDEKGN